MRTPRSWLKDVDSYRPVTRSGVGPRKNVHRRTGSDAIDPKEHPSSKKTQGPEKARGLQHSSTCCSRNRSVAPIGHGIKASFRNAHRSTSLQSSVRSKGHAACSAVDSTAALLALQPSVLKRSSELQLPIPSNHVNEQGSGNAPDSKRSSELQPPIPSNQANEQRSKSAPEDVTLPAKAIFRGIESDFNPTSSLASLGTSTPHALTDSALKKSEELLAEMAAAFDTEETPSALERSGKRRLSLESVAESVLSSFSFASVNQAESARQPGDTVEVPVNLLEMLTDIWGKYRDMTENSHELVNQEELDDLKQDLVSLLQSDRQNETSEIDADSSTGSEAWDRISALRKKLARSSVGSLCSTSASVMSPSMSLSTLSRSPGVTCDSLNASLSSPSWDSKSPIESRRNSVTLRSPPDTRSNSFACVFECTGRMTQNFEPPPRSTSTSPTTAQTCDELAFDSSMSMESTPKHKGSTETTRALSSASPPTLHHSISAPTLEHPFTPRMMLLNVPVLQASRHLSLAGSLHTPAAPAKFVSPRESSRQLSPGGSLHVPSRQPSPREISRQLSSMGSLRAPTAPSRQLSPMGSLHAPTAPSGQLSPRAPSRQLSPGCSLHAPAAPSGQLSPRGPSRQLSPRERHSPNSPRNPPRVMSPRGVRSQTLASPRDAQSSKGLSVSSSASALPVWIAPEISPREGRHRSKKLLSRARITQTVNITNVVDIYASC